jgi:Tfp pilus assembly protein PilF
MRWFPIVLFVGVAGGSVATSVAGQQPDHQLAPRSVALLKQGEAAFAAGNYAAADDALETALVADPRNRSAFVALARVSIKQKLYGQAVRYTNKALQLEPTDTDALAVQGEALVEEGAVAKAQETLARLRKLCGATCPQGDRLAAVIARGPTVAVAKPVAVPPKRN